MNATSADHHYDRVGSRHAAKVVWRANIILATPTSAVPPKLCADEAGGMEMQARFMAEGVEGLTRDKTRTPGKRPLSTDTVQRVVDLALGPPPGEENPLLLDPPIATGHGRKLRC